jgi:hypothetical protein
MLKVTVKVPFWEGIERFCQPLPVIRYSDGGAAAMAVPAIHPDRPLSN